MCLLNFIYVLVFCVMTILIAFDVVCVCIEVFPPITRQGTAGEVSASNFVGDSFGQSCQVKWDDSSMFP